MNKSDALKQLLEAIEAFTDQEGNMPADTGEFNDLKDCIAPLRAFIATEEAKPPLSAERGALVESLRAHAYLHEALDDPTQVQWGDCLRSAADMLAADAKPKEIKNEQVRPEVDAVGRQQSVEMSGDSFNGDDHALVAAMVALLKLDAAGALVPHGIGGHARVLLKASANRLAAGAQKCECTEYEFCEPCLEKRKAQQVAVPQGWKLVTVEPTQEMLDSMFASQAKHGSTEKLIPLGHLINLSKNKVREALSEAYRVAISTTPQLPQADARVPMTQTEIDDLPSCGINDGSQQWLRGYLRLVEAHHGIGVKP